MSYAGPRPTALAVLIHHSGKAHLPGRCIHPPAWQYFEPPVWGWVEDREAWKRILAGDPLQATSGNTTLVAVSPCGHCPRENDWGVLAMCLFPEVGYQLIWQKLTASLTTPPIVTPTAKALRDLRRRVGSTPMRCLFEIVCGRWPNPQPPGRGSGPTARSPSTLQLAQGPRHRPQPGMARQPGPRRLPPNWN
ncbi:transposase domain-containing protein [Microtetraspora fusca]|uniref:transposase domain-containing protein n=1 Tax=Microtetraspora fusca TaxID=1997 RepID=UPI0012F7118A|nr:transposase domain-containing protein [Microtetraspora fusca]